MPKDLPVGVAQSAVLKALGETAHTWSQAEAIFERYGIVVRAKRQGRTSVPVVSERKQDLGGWTDYGDYDGVDPLPSKLSPAQRAALAPYWQDSRRD
jgi:hypothetical protein